MSVAPTRGKGAGKGQVFEEPRKSVKSDDEAPARKINCPMPICGGWCAATENPDESFFRHFSNEWTIPAQACFFACLPCLETNKFCQIVGHFAFQVSTGVRKAIFSVGLILSLIVMVIFFLTFMGLLTSEGGIRTFHWFKGTWIVPNTGTENPTTVTMYFGINGRITEITNVSPELHTKIDAEILTAKRGEKIQVGGTQKGSDTPLKARVIGQYTKGDPFASETQEVKDARWNESIIDTSEETGGKFKHTFVYNTSEFCPVGELTANKACYENEGHTKFVTIFMLCILAFVAQITAAMANCQRWTEFGDVNCQKFWAFLSAVIVCTSAFSIYFTAVSIANIDIPSQLNPIGLATAEPVATEQGVRELSIWMTLILVAAIIKILDVIIHCLVATPPGRHHKPDERNPYVDLPDYLLRFQDCEHPAIPYSATH